MRFSVFFNAEKELCRVQARRSFNNGRYGNALDWALRSQDNLYVTSIADHFLHVSAHNFTLTKHYMIECLFHCIWQHYTKTGEMLCEDVIRNVGAKMFISPRLVFLVKYCDFQNYHRTQQYAAAAELLINLLDSKIAPAYFWPSMFADTFSLLEAADPIFSSKETHKIMQHLESNLLPLLDNLKKSLHNGAKPKSSAIAEWEPLLLKASSLHKSDGSNNSQSSFIGNIEFMVKIIRLACIRNLSRSIILENTAVWNFIL